MDIEALAEQFCRELRYGIADALCEWVISHPDISEDCRSDTWQIVSECRSEVALTGQRGFCLVRKGVNQNQAEPL